MPLRIGSDYTSEQLRNFLYRYRLSLTAGSELLGVARRTLQSYTSGEEVIPLSIARLCWWMDRALELGAREDDLNAHGEGIPYRLERPTETKKEVNDV